MIVVISGSPGTGKTTLAKYLAKKLGFGFIEAGEIFDELGKKIKNRKKLDRAVNKKIKTLVKKNKNYVLDSRLASFLLKANLKIFLVGDINIRAKRMAKREKISIAKAKKNILERERKDKRAFKKYYPKIRNIESYDLVLDTTRLSKKEMFDLVFLFVKKVI